MPKATSQKRLNRDHARQQQRPMVEEEVHQKGLATDPVLYFAAPENQDLGVVKTVRKPNVKLIIAPFPESRSDLSIYVLVQDVSNPVCVSFV